MTSNELAIAYLDLDPNSKNRSEHVSFYLMKKYGYSPNIAWFNVYAQQLSIAIRNQKMLLPIGMEISFYIKKSEEHYECIGAGVIENKPGFMKFTPLYLYNSYDNDGAMPNEKIYVYVTGFAFTCVPELLAKPFGSAVELKELKLG
jgi:hypothetical protein